MCELPVELVPYGLSISKPSISGTYSSLSALEQIEDMDGQGCDCRPPKLTGACSAVIPSKEALLELLIIDGSSGSRDVIYPTPGGGLLGERPVVSGRRKRTTRIATAAPGEW